MGKAAKAKKAAAAASKKQTPEERRAAAMDEDAFPNDYVMDGAGNMLNRRDVIQALGERVEIIDGQGATFVNKVRPTGGTKVFGKDSDCVFTNMGDFRSTMGFGFVQCPQSTKAVTLRLKLTAQIITLVYDPDEEEESAVKFDEVLPSQEGEKPKKLKFDAYAFDDVVSYTGDASISHVRLVNYAEVQVPKLEDVHDELPYVDVKLGTAGRLIFIRPDFTSTMVTRLLLSQIKKQATDTAALVAEQEEKEKKRVENIRAGQCRLQVERHQSRRLSPSPGSPPVTRTSSSNFHKHLETLSRVTEAAAAAVVAAAPAVVAEAPSGKKKSRSKDVESIAEESLDSLTENGEETKHKHHHHHHHKDKEGKEKKDKKDKKKKSKKDKEGNDDDEEEKRRKKEKKDKKEKKSKRKEKEEKPVEVVEEEEEEEADDDDDSDLDLAMFAGGKSRQPVVEESDSDDDDEDESDDDEDAFLAQFAKQKKNKGRRSPTPPPESGSDDDSDESDSEDEDAFLAQFAKKNKGRGRAGKKVQVDSDDDDDDDSAAAVIQFKHEEVVDDKPGKGGKSKGGRRRR
ncbi:ATP-binding cassette sub- F member 1 [Perkinsus chesapeaki]|uniref:ATP-binding cassette sub- F member 1 n=1 Tax=Perkinsus chesapeaki TaxID=330153 RepID=A0A7J6MJL6_PERCH|nr:ATP-binding cassette sub- F member 1 [Perkinsus chesapeaki]